MFLIPRMNMKNIDFSNEELLSKTIQFLRFPLIIGVVLIHSQVLGEGMLRVSENPTLDFPIYSTISYLFSSIIARIAVPLFFFFSGFLFFYRVSFNFSVYINKLKKRCRTLLLPYLLWNLFAVVLTFALHFFLSDMVVEGAESKLSFLDYLQSFWNYKQFHRGAPMNGPLWFIRDLMIVMLASPLVFFFIKYSRQYGIIALGILWFFGWWPLVTGFDKNAWFFFSAGAYFSIHQNNFVKVFSPLLWIALAIYIVSTILQLYLWNYRGDLLPYISNINILSGIVLAISSSSVLLRIGLWKVNPFLSEASFFIYVYHGLIVYRITSRAFMLLPHTDMALLFIYLMCPIVILGIGLPLYYCLRKKLPRTTALLMGGR